MISVLILTLNEEANLPLCLEAVKWSDDIVIFDSFSSDATVDIARAAGARVIKRVFDNEHNHRAVSLQTDFKYRWVYNPDADEITTEELRDEMLAVVKDKSRPEVAYRVRFKNIFMGRWIRHSSLYPTWIMRLFQPEKVSFGRKINMQYMIHGPEGRLSGHILHHSFNKGFNAWIDKHNLYSWHEAQETLLGREARALSLHDLFSWDSVRRRKAMKEMSYFLPCRPTFRFIFMYLWRMGFLDGWPGFTYCRLLSIYEYMIVLKMNEMRRRGKGLPI